MIVTSVKVWHNQPDEFLYDIPHSIPGLLVTQRTCSFNTGSDPRGS